MDIRWLQNNLRPDTVSGDAQLTLYNPLYTGAAGVGGGKVAQVFNEVFIPYAHVSTVQGPVSGNVTTTSTGLVSSGVGVELDTHFTGRIKIIVYSQFQVTVAGEPIFRLFHNTSAVPASGTAVGGDTGISPQFGKFLGTANVDDIFALQWSYTPGALETTNTFFPYLAFASPVGTTTVTLIQNKTYLYAEEL